MRSMKPKANDDSKYSASMHNSRLTGRITSKDIEPVMIC